MTIEKQYLIELDQKNLNQLNRNKTEDYIKEIIFSGKIIVFKDLFIIKKIITCVENLCLEYFNGKELNFFLKKNINSNLEKRFIDFQSEIKRSFRIKTKFRNFIKYLRFNEQETFSDKICLRFNPGEKKKNLGNLNFVNAHRDTWASNLFEQINWWLPLFDIKDTNSIFFYPNYYKKSIKNDSHIWTFEKYKSNKKKYISTPIITEHINEKEKLIIKINKGDILCFSGHHLHGSNFGKLNRMNIENRTISLGDRKKYFIPENLDGKYNVIQKRWFKNINDDSNLT